MIEQLTGLAYMLALYGALWLANMFFSIANNLQNGESWNWRKFFAGWRTALLGGVGLVFTVGAILFIPSVFELNNITISDEWKSAISILAIVAGLAGGVLSYAKKAVASIVAFANLEDVKLEIKPDADNWNKGSIETITGEFTTKELEEASENE